MAGTGTPTQGPLDGRSHGAPRAHTFTDAIVRAFLGSNLSVVLIALAVFLGAAALVFTPREEDPQIVVPLADVYVQAPGLSAAEVEQLVSTPLEKFLYQIDGVEYVYSLSRPDEAVITVRFYVGEDRERSLVKLFKKIDEHRDRVPPGVTGWVMKPVEIDDVPIVTLTLSGAAGDGYLLRRIGEEAAERLARVAEVSRAYVVGGQPRAALVYLGLDRLQAYNLAPLAVADALRGANVTLTSGDISHGDRRVQIAAGARLSDPRALGELVVGVAGDKPVFLKDVADVVDGPDEPVAYVRHGWGPAQGFTAEHGFPGSLIGEHAARPGEAADRAEAQPAVTVAIAKKRGSNAVRVAEDVLRAADQLRRDALPDDVELIITRNSGLTADHKVNELVEALAVAILIVIALLTLSLGWREALIVAVAVPVVFGLTLAVNLLLGYSINRVTLFALILSLGLLVDDPIVDVENIARHFGFGRRTRRTVMEAVAEIRPPLITATLAVIVSFLPMFFITGMMGPYMRPMALNVPVAMLMSMVVAFTITPWLAYHVLRRGGRHGGAAAASGDAPQDAGDELEAVRRSLLWRLFHPLMAPLLRSRRLAWSFLGAMALLMVAAMGLAATRSVPLKMLPFDNKNELLLVLDFPEGTTLERSDAAVRAFEHFLARVPEVADYVSYVGLASPIDFNGLVRHYYLRQGDHVADIRVNLVGKRNRRQQSHAIGLRLRDELTALAADHGAALKIVELPPGPPVLASVVAEVYGRPDQTYDDLIAAAQTVRARLALEPGVVDVDDYIESPRTRMVLDVDQEKAAISGVSVDAIAESVRLAVGGLNAGTVRLDADRNPLRIVLRLPEAQRSSAEQLGQLHVLGRGDRLVPLAELGRWREERVEQTIYHKNLERVMYVIAETAGRPPADCVVDVQADRRQHGLLAVLPSTTAPAVWGGEVADTDPSGRPIAARPVGQRTFVNNGGGIPWMAPDGIRVDFAGEGEWKITLDVFRDLGLAFGAAMIGIYVLLVAQTGSFVIPLVVMLAIPLTVIGVMPGFWLLNVIAGQQVGQYSDPVLFTATGMIGMIALAGIVTRDAIILVDFIHLSLARGRSLFDAVMESRVVRLRPILLTAGAAMLGAAPITIDPIFSGLAWALIFGLFASTVFTLFVIPVAYWLLYERVPGHGLPDAGVDA